MNNHIRIGTRASRLALWQAEHVRDLLTAQAPDCDFEVVKIKTEGDVGAGTQETNAPVEGKNVFVRRIEEALMKQEIDLAVHSLKDMSAQPVKGLMVRAYVGGASRYDVLICREGGRLHDLPAGARIGTGSARRAAQIKCLRNDVACVGIRGNVDTRLKKLEDGQYDALILAKAGLQRLGFEDRISYQFSIDQMIPAPGQGVIAVQTRSMDYQINDLVGRINDGEAALCAGLEFKFMQLSGAGCHVPLGIMVSQFSENLQVYLFAASQDHKQNIKLSREFHISKRDEIPAEIFKNLKDLWYQKMRAQLTFHEH